MNHAANPADLLSGQKLVVLGGTSGIGLEVARAAAARGARVVIAGRDRTRADAACASLAGEAVAHALDAGDRSALDAFFDEVGPVDHLVLTLSGGEGGGEFASLDLQALRRGFEAKFWPQLETVQAALPALAPAASVTSSPRCRRVSRDRARPAWRQSTVRSKQWSAAWRASSRRDA